MFRNVWKSISFGNPRRPKRHKYHNSWKRNTLQLLMFWGLNDAWGIKCLHQFARSCFHNSDKSGHGFGYKTIAFSMISQNHMLRNVWTSTSSGTLNWSKRLMITVVFRHSSCSKSNAKRRPITKTINITIFLPCFLEIV